MDEVNKVCPHYIPNNKVCPHYIPNSKVCPHYIPNNKFCPHYVPNNDSRSFICSPVPSLTELFGGNFKVDLLPKTYEGVSKIFRTDTVKIIKLTLRSIGRHHPRINFLPQVDTGPTISSIFETKSFSVRVSSTVCDSAWISSMVSNRRHSSFNFISGNRKKSRGAKSGKYGWWGMKAIYYFARNCWVRTEMCDGALSW
jgi:hypothetical protein